MVLSPPWPCRQDHPGPEQSILDKADQPVRVCQGLSSSNTGNLVFWESSLSWANWDLITLPWTG